MRSLKKRNEMVLEYLDIVSRCQHRLQRKRIDPDDLWQVGVLGLIKAIETFDSSRGDLRYRAGRTTLKTWAGHCVRSAMLDWLRHELGSEKRSGREKWLAQRIIVDEPVDELPLLVPPMELAPHIQADEFWVRVRTVVSRQQYLVLEAYYRRGLTFTQMSRQRGMDESTPRHYHEVALAKLRRWWTGKSKGVASSEQTVLRKEWKRGGGK